MPRLAYYRRIFSAYLLGGKSHLTFWHETPAENPNATTGKLGQYYMQFAEKADYQGSYDSAGVPQLDYHGKIGLQYNPIAIAQYALGNYNLFRQTADPGRRQKFFIAADWLASHLEQNPQGLSVWNHHFDWEYRNPLRAPWYSALAQGQGISVLLRAHKESAEKVNTQKEDVQKKGVPEEANGEESAEKKSNDSPYLAAARRALACFHVPTKDGGVAFTDESNDLWFEEYIVTPPTHILNGFIWAAWGLYDYYVATQDASGQKLFAAAVRTMLHNLDRYDLGFWSLYEQSGTRLPMVASPFYHHLHIVQLRVMHRLTGESTFARVADRWETYTHSPVNRARALAYKTVFKLGYY